MLAKMAVILIPLIAINSCGKKDFRSDYFTVSKVKSGNTLGLINGYDVRLIGIEDNKKTFNYLNNELINKRVRFEFDSKCPLRKATSTAKYKLFYAYVIDEKGKCINSDILQKNLCRIPYPQPYLNDSLKQFQRYVDSGFPGFEDNETKRNDNSVNRSCESELKQLIRACDYKDPITRNFAVRVAGNAPGNFNIAQICEIYDAIRPPNWHYVNDPRGMDFYSQASHTIEKANLSGDCDDFAILIYSLVTAIGGEARVVFAWNENSGHAFTELNIYDTDIERLLRRMRKIYPGYSINKLHYRRDIKGNKWLNLDWWSQYPGGKYMNFNRTQVYYPYEKKCE
jgi:hypothetical protein